MNKKIQPKELNLFDKLHMIKETIGGVKKKASNPFFSSKYADLNEVMDTLAPAMIEQNLLYIQVPEVKDGVDMLTTVIVNRSNPDEKITSSIRLAIPAPDMQKLGGAITYARRYALISMFGLEAIDDDGNTASGKSKPKTASQLHNDRINEAKKKLDEAKANGDYDTASDIYDYAKESGFTQVCDYYSRLFESESTEKDGM